MNMQYFGNKLKHLRESKNITQKELAEKLGIVKSSVSAYEMDRTYPSISILREICTIFNVSADYMLGLTDDIVRQDSMLTDKQVEVVRQMIHGLEEDNASRL